MNYPNPPSPEITTKEKPAFKKITSELLRELESALNNATLWKEQVNLSLKGVKRILEVITVMDFFQKANEIDERLRGIVKWLENSSDGLQTKMREYESYFTDFNTSMRSNEQEVTNTLNANTENIKSEVKKLENQIIEATTRLLTSYQIFLNQARENATNQITANQTQVLNNINEAKENANNEINTNQTQAITNISEAKESAQAQINTNKQEVLNNITQEKQQATSEITQAKKTAFNELLETLKPKFSGLFAGVYYIRNVIYIQGGWEQKVKDLSDYTLDKSKKYEIEVFFSFVTAKKTENSAFFGLKTTEGFLKESIQKITHKYVSQTYHTKLLVENVSGVLALYHGYFYGNINYFNEAIITIISTKKALKGL
ncbi:ATP synthase F0 subunit B [Helicobacter pylori]|uniref:ATP synthase F0 subunit B n=1 Tax=Helicobacter pylori TaxID=210 RepID=UPI0013DF4B19|nr:ATP synthase F0 subunit B [Helicobacter pylori]NGP14872.1 ATP synthase F0 subunit B [Helicobacter pylori]